MIERLDYAFINSAAIASMAKAKTHMGSIEKRLRAMVELRVSQMNGCAYCVDLHSCEARDAGESQQRLDCLIVWNEVSFFDPAEKAAFAWTEAVTMIADQGAPQTVFENLQTHYTDEQIVDLTLIIAQMNAWNRMAISMGHGPVDRG